MSTNRFPAHSPTNSALEDMPALSPAYLGCRSVANWEGESSGIDPSPLDQSLADDKPRSKFAESTRAVRITVVGPATLKTYIYPKD
jgi:hypothetical protein